MNDGGEGKGERRERLAVRKQTLALSHLLSAHKPALMDRDLDPHVPACQQRLLQRDSLGVLAQ